MVDLDFGEVTRTVSLALIRGPDVTNLTEFSTSAIVRRLESWQVRLRKLEGERCRMRPLNGVMISGASDWPVSSANVFQAIYQAETRRSPEGVPDPSQRMPREAIATRTRETLHAR
jgi:hypothetical protein